MTKLIASFLLGAIFATTGIFIATRRPCADAPVAHPKPSSPPATGTTANANPPAEAPSPALTDEQRERIRRNYYEQRIDRRKKRFDDPKRVADMQPDKVIAVFNVKKDEVVADIGAGTGFYAFRLADAVGPQGKVYATELEDDFLEALRKRVEEDFLTQVTVVKSTVADPTLPDASCDKIFLGNVYDHLKDRITFMERIRKALKPGGLVAVVENDLEKSNKAREQIPADERAKRAPLTVHLNDPLLTESQVIEEMKAAGFTLREKHDFIEKQHFLIFGATR